MAKSKVSSPKAKANISTTVARTDDGSVQITFSLPWSEVLPAQDKALKELGQEITVPGFRKGMAPADKVMQSVSEQKLIEKVLTILLPDKLGDAISENNIRPAIYPRFELIKTVQNEDWEVRAITAEIPEVSLDGYKDKLVGEIRAKQIVKPGDDSKNEKTIEEKQDLVLRALIESIDIKIPALLIKEESDSRLSQLLQRIEKLGLKLESYLASVGKDPETLRAEYAQEAKNAITLDILLTKIAESEKLTVSEAEIEAALHASEADPKTHEHLHSPEQMNLLRVILLKRKAVDYLTSLYSNS